MNVSNCILTDRLILRPFVKSDEEDLLAIMSDKEFSYSRFGTVESEERFTITRGDFEWEQRGKSYFSTAS